MKFKKVYLSLLATFICLFSVSFINGSIITKAATIQEQETVENEDDPEPRWWPGNPNSFPGSEAWLQQHINYSSEDPVKARECLVEAFGPAPLGASAIEWILGGTFTVASCLKTFGLNNAIEWLICMLGL